MRGACLRGFLASCGAWLMPAVVAGAAVDVEFRVECDTYEVGDDVRVGLYAVSDLPSGNQLISALEVIFEWDETVLRLDGLSTSGGPGLVFQGFPTTDYGGLNEADPPQDGDGMYVGLGPLGTPIQASPSGRLITVFVFEALASSNSTDVLPVATGGSPLQGTIVYSGVTPNVEVTGVLSGDDVEIVQQGCDGDVDGNNIVDVNDVSFVIFRLGNTGPCGPPGDADGNGVVDVNDISYVIFRFGPCPP